jgi:Ala-tRNA(Pro) deacylase
MALPACVANALKQQRMPFVTFRHPRAYTALEQAAVSHTPGRCSAKVVICMADDKPVQAIVPAHYLLDLEQLRLITGAGVLRLAREDEIAALYPEFEVGAIPPFGTMSGHRVFVEQCFVGEPEMVFRGGTLTDSICMHYSDFAEMVNPVVGAFGLRPGRRQRTPRPSRIGERQET